MIGSYLITQTGITLFWLGLFGMLLGWGYSAPRLNLNSHGLGNSPSWPAFQPCRPC